MTDVDDEKAERSKTPSTTTTTTTTTSTISDDGDSSEKCGSDNDENDKSAWLSSEPHNNLLSSCCIDEERVKIREILTHLTPDERAEIERVDTSIPIRHLRANKGDVTKAVHSVQSTLQWRRDFRVDIITSCFAVENTADDTDEHREMRDIFKTEAATGKMYVRGYDKEGRALLYMCQMRENTGHELNNMRYLVHALEKAIACTKQKSGLEKVVLLIDFAGFTMSKSASVSTSRHTLDILQKRYPERMKRSFIMSPPLMFKAFWTLIKPFVDPVTKSKIVFCTTGGSEVLATVDHPDVLELRAYGTGAHLREFDAATYLQLPLDESY